MSSPVDPKRLRNAGEDVPAPLRQALEAKRGDLPNAQQLTALTGRLGSLLDAPWPPSGGPPPAAPPPAPVPLPPPAAAPSSVVPLAAKGVALGKLAAWAAASLMAAGAAGVALTTRGPTGREVVAGGGSGAASFAASGASSPPNPSSSAAATTPSTDDGSPPALAAEPPPAASVEADFASDRSALRREKPEPSAGLGAAPAKHETLPEPSAVSAGAEAPSEVQLLRQAQGLVAVSPSAALGLCDQHARRFAGGGLTQEREVIAIDALRRLGRRAEANERAGRFFQRFPGSAHRQKIEGLLKK